MSDRLRIDLASRILGARAPETEKARYFWPLARPAWTAEECVAALQPWIEARTTMWRRTEAFEAAFAARFEHRAALLCNSGSSADLLAMLALATRTDLRPESATLPPRSLVLMPAVTWPTQVWACLWAGCDVMLLDVDPETLTVTPDTVKTALEMTKARALFVTHLMGLPWDMGAIADLCERHDCVLLEDCCEALGAAWDGQPVGTFGLFGTYSLFVAHHLSAGEGGIVGINDPDRVPWLRAIRAHGWTRNCEPGDWREALRGFDGDARYAFVTHGGNFRPTETTAAVAQCQLDRWNKIAGARARVAKRIFAAVEARQGIRVPRVLPHANPSWFGIPIFCESKNARDALVDRFEVQGVETRAIVAGNLLRQPGIGPYRDRILASGVGGADEITVSGCYVGILPDASDDEVDRLCAIIAG